MLGNDLCKYNRGLGLNTKCTYGNATISCVYISTGGTQTVTGTARQLEPPNGKLGVTFSSIPCKF